MTREEQIEFEANLAPVKLGWGIPDGTAESGDIATAFRMGIEWADANRWISVEDELPEIDVEYPSYSISVIVINHCGDWSKGYWSFNDELWITENYGSIHEITHWMPIPEPPKI